MKTNPQVLPDSRRAVAVRRLHITAWRLLLRWLSATLALIAFLNTDYSIRAQGTAFTYQGRLDDNGSPATGSYDFRFRLAADALGNNFVGGPVLSNAVPVIAGLFTVMLDFGQVFNGSNIWLEVDLKTNGAAGYTVLTPLQQLTPAPYAITASNLTGTLSASQLTGTVPDSRLSSNVSLFGIAVDSSEIADGTVINADISPSAAIADTKLGTIATAGKVANSATTATSANAANRIVSRDASGNFNAATITADKFSGDGANLTALNASQLMSGTVPDLRLGTNVARLDQVWGLAGNTGVNPAFDFVGTTDPAPLAFRAGNREVMRMEGQATGYRIIAGVNSVVHTTTTNSAVLGGRDGIIEANAPESTIVGGQANVIRSDQRSAFIGGGARNEIRVDNQHAVIVGGRDNRIGTNSVISLVVGGAENVIADNVDGGLMVGGFRNDVRGSHNPNRREIAPVLVGGSDNEIGLESGWTVILGGDNNRIGTNCASAVIAGGTNNLVADNCGFSFAAGRRCRVNHLGAFVWADSQNASFASAGDNTFNIRAEGGVHLNADTSQFFGSSTRQMINLYSDTYGIGVQSGTEYFRSATRFSWFFDGTHSNTQNDPGAGGTVAMTLTGSGLTVNGVVVSSSDRNVKSGFAPVDPKAVLEKVAALPITRWHFTNDVSTAHIGPVAQDFHAAFGVGPDDKHIATVDADGVALAAIQGLNQKVEDRDAEIAALKRKLERLERLVDKLVSAKE